MEYPNFVVGNYRSQSKLEANHVVMNFYPEKLGAPGRWPAAYYPTPGQTTVRTVADVVGRGAFTIDGRTHLVIGPGVYEYFVATTATKRGNVPSDSRPASMAYNGTAGNQICIASGGALTYLDLATNMLTAVTGVTFTNVIQVGMVDTFFVALDVGQNRLYVSDASDTSAVWDPTQFIQRTTQPDKWQAIAVIPPDIWCIGELTGDVLYDRGSSPFPLAPRPGITFRYGTSAPASVASIGNSVLWLAKDKDGIGVVVQTVGYQPQPISDKSLETAISTYARMASIDNAEGLTYEEDGHQFYVLHFPSVPATHVYDLSTQVWHSRGKWNAPINSYDLWPARVHTLAFGKHIVLDHATGNINEMSVTMGSEADGSAIVRELIPPPLWSKSGNSRMFVPRFELMLEPGLGLVTGQGGNPLVMLRTTTNMKTWSNQRTCSAGSMGNYNARTFWLQNGSSTMLWAPRLTFSDPIPWRVLGAEVDVTGSLLEKARQ